MWLVLVLQIIVTWISYHIIGKKIPLINNLDSYTFRRVVNTNKCNNIKCYSYSYKNKNIYVHKTKRNKNNWDTLSHDSSSAFNLFL